MRWIKRVPLICAGLYLLSVAANGAYVIYRSEFAPENGEFAGMGLFVLTLPWSFVLDPFLRSGGGPEGERPIYLVVGRFLLYGIVNAAIIYAAFALLSRLAGVNRNPAA